MPRETLECITMAIFKRTGKIVGQFIIWGDEDRKDRFNELFNNPVTNWVGRSVENLYWTYRHCEALFYEHSFRHNERHYLTDKFYEVAHWIKYTELEPKVFRNSSGLDTGHIFDDYKKSLCIKWFTTDIKEPIWTRREKPVWTKKYLEQQGKISFVKQYKEDELPF